MTLKLQEGIMPDPNNKRDPIRKHLHTALVCLNVVSGTTALPIF